MAALAALLPNDDVINSWTDLSAALGWAQLPADLLLSLIKELGEDALPTMQVLASVEDNELREAMGKIGVTAMKKARMNLLLNCLRKRFGLPLVDYLAAAPAPSPGPSLPSSSSSGAAPSLDPTVLASIVTAVTAATKPNITLGAVKMSHVIDQASSDEVPPLDEMTINALRKELHRKLEGEPLETEEYTDAQLTAFKRKLDAGQSPACDYAVLGPYGVRSERRMKFMATIKNTDGTERTVEIAGPDCLDTWEACHAIFKNLCLSCGVAKAATLDNYRARFRERCLEFPDQWALAMAADHICRSEHWNRVKSQQQRMHDNDATRALSAFDPSMPWDSAIAASTSDSEFWSRYFDKKCLKALANGKRNAPIHEQPYADGAPVKRQKPAHAGRVRDEASWDPDARRADGRLFKDKGYDFCRAYHHDGGCNEASCSGGRSHRCEFCKGWHRSSDCGSKPEGWAPIGKAKGNHKGNGKGVKGKGKKNDKGKGNKNGGSRAW